MIHSRSANDLLRMKRMSMQSSQSMSALHSAHQSESSENTKPRRDKVEGKYSRTREEFAYPNQFNNNFSCKAQVDGEKERIDGSAASKTKKQTTSNSDESS